MQAFHNDPTIKAFYLERVNQHFIQDEIIKGFYWQDGKGCAVGCTIHGNDHADYEKELGIPIILAKLEDNIFENLPNERAKTWPKEFLEAIHVGANLSTVWPEFAIWLLTDKEFGVIQFADTEESKMIIQTVSDCYEKYSQISLDEWLKLKDQACSVPNSTDCAGYFADFAAYSALIAAQPNFSLDSSSYAVTCLDDAINAARHVITDAVDFVEKKWRTAQANKLLELLKNTK